MARLDYANARIAARRERLVGPGWVRDLLARPTQEARIEALRAASAFAERLPVDVGAGDAALAAIEAALRADVRREALAILDGAEGTRVRARLEAFLALEEADLVKAVLRGVARGAALNATLAAAPGVPGVSEEGVRAAASASTVEEALAALEAAGSAIATAVRPALPSLAQRGLFQLELAADRAAFERARLAARGRGEDALILAAYVADRVDARNAATLLARAGAPPVEDAFLDGGRRFGRGKLRQLAGTAPEAVRAALAAAFGIDAAALATPWSADRAIERALVAPLRRDMRLRPLSIAVPLAYLLERRAETRRVALVLRGTAIGLSGDELLDLVEA